jgi:ASC-1-like (ASCH) protein
LELLLALAALRFYDQFHEMFRRTGSESFYGDLILQRLETNREMSRELRNYLSSG